MTTYVFDMGDGTVPWKISNRAIEKIDDGGTETMVLTISFWDWAFVDLVSPKGKHTKRFTLSSNPAKDELARLRALAVDKATPEDVTPGNSLFGDASDSITAPKKQKRQRDAVDPPTFVEVWVTIPENSSVMPKATKGILMRYTTKTKSPIAIKLDADAIEFLVAFIRSFLETPSQIGEQLFAETDSVTSSAPEGSQVTP